MLASRDDLFQCKPRSEIVDIDGKQFRVMGFTSRDRREFLDKYTENGNGETHTLKAAAPGAIIQLCLVDVDDNRLLSEEDIPLIDERLNVRVVDKLVSAAYRVCGLGKDAEDALKKDSEAGPTSSSVTS